MTGGSSAAIGLGRTVTIQELMIHCPPSGTTDRFADVAMDRIYRVRESTTALEEIQVKSVGLGGQ